MAHAAAPTTHPCYQPEADNEDECEKGTVPPGKISEPGKILETGKKARRRESEAPPLSVAAKRCR